MGKKGSNPAPPAGTKRPKPPANPPGIPAPGDRGIIDELVDIYRGAAKEITAGQQSSRAEALRAMRAAYEPRHLVREEVIEFDEAPYYIDRGVAIELPDNHTVAMHFMGNAVCPEPASRVIRAVAGSL